MSVRDAKRALGRQNAEVREHPRQRDSVIVNCDDNDLRAVKAKLQRAGYSYQPRRNLHGVEKTRDTWHVFKESSGSRGPPRNSKELTRGLQSGDLDFTGTK